MCPQDNYVRTGPGRILLRINTGEEKSNSR